MEEVLTEAVKLATADCRRHWLVFCVGVSHAEKVTEWLIAHAISAGMVVGATPSQQRADTICRFKKGQITALVSVGVLTTGFDAPETDCIIIARPTLSPVLHCQIMGRGMRPTPEKIAIVGEGEAAMKRGCLVLDFVGNVERHGPINRITLKEPSPKKEMPTKFCGGCQAEVRISAKVCPNCGYEFPPPDEKLKERPRNNLADLIFGLAPNRVIRYDIHQVRYNQYIGKSGIPVLRVNYFSGFLRVASDWVCLEHKGFARKKAEQWWSARTTQEAPQTIRQAIVDSPALVCPLSIEVRFNQNGFPEVVRYEWTAQSKVA